jgi:hypothetical protein
MSGQRRAAATLAVLLAAGGCGTSGSTTPQPIETLIYVSGGPATFSLPNTPNAAACGGDGTGIQAPNASHQFPGRTFQTPHLFVLEKILQPVQVVIQNQSTTAAIRVDTYLGFTPQNSNVTINPGECQTIRTTGPPPTPQPSGAQIQIEVCAPLNDMGVQDVSLPCTTSTADRSIAYFATLGDIATTNITNCILSPILDNCRSPSTFFIEQPIDEVDAIMSVNSGQNPSSTPPLVALRLELYVNDQQVDISTGTGPVVTANL